MNKENLNKVVPKVQPPNFYKATSGSEVASSRGSADSMAAKTKGKSGQFKGGQNDESDDMLPEIGHKFSSWSKEDQNLNELDELLMEHDLLAQPAGGYR